LAKKVEDQDANVKLNNLALIEEILLAKLIDRAQHNPRTSFIIFKHARLSIR